MEPPTVRTTVPPVLDGERLDRALVALTEGFSRSRLQVLIREGRVRVDGEAVQRPNASVAQGSELVLALPDPAEPASGDGTRVELEILFEDEHLVVVNKPAGMLAHASERERAGTVADLAVERYGPLPEVQGKGRPGIVHRLDRQTSGVMVLGRSAGALEGLKAQFKARAVEKTYLAICHNEPRFVSEWIEAPIGRSPRHRDRHAVLPGGEGREALTFIEVRERFRGFALMAAHPKTGRTHQVRVHLTHVGLPIVGDRVYRHPGALRVPVPADAPAPGRQALHAARIAFDHPASGERVAFEAPLPEDMEVFLAWLRGAATG